MFQARETNLRPVGLRRLSEGRRQFFDRQSISSPSGAQDGHSFAFLCGLWLDRRFGVLRRLRVRTRKEVLRCGVPIHF